MSHYRKTAIVRLVLPSGASDESLPLTTDRAYGVFLNIDGKDDPSGYFRSPINDEQWRDFRNRMSSCNTVRDPRADDLAFRNAMFIQDIGISLFKALCTLNDQLKAFLGGTGISRRLVIQTQRTELHLLPWGGMCDLGGKLLAAGNLSIVQAWDDFSDSQTVTQSRMTLTRVAGKGTSQVTADALATLMKESGVVTDFSPASTAGTSTVGPDILHVEAHGDAVTNQIGGASSTRFANSYGKPKIALLWSCFSGAANSWGDSPALWLHRDGAAMVLSFQAELHVNDAASIAQSFYSEVFGPAASRDPEAALMHARSAKFVEGFQYACWASMTVYLRSPLDLSALPLNGPRVPKSGFADPVDVDPAGTPVAATPRAAPAPDPWAIVDAEVRRLSPGMWKQLDTVADVCTSDTKLPREAFGGWRGNVIRLDGADDPLIPDVLTELELDRAKAPDGDAAERLVWFFTRIARYGSPLIVWTNAAHHLMEFLAIIQPDPAITFLLLTGPQKELTVPQWLDRGELAQAQAAADALPEASLTDEVLSAAYYACVRGEDPQHAIDYLNRVKSLQEWLLLKGNFLSRGNALNDAEMQSLGGRFCSPIADPGETAALGAEFALLHQPEDFYRFAMNQPGGESSLRETGRARHELAYLMQSQGRPGTAELLYRLALADLAACPAADHDSRWYFALSSALRDLADLLASQPSRADEATKLLDRAMAIQAFHGMRLQLGYSKTTAARIALTGCHFNDAVHAAVDAANRMEQCNNWRGWKEALCIMLDSLAETRETARMKSVTILANDKLRLSNLKEADREPIRRIFTFQKARAHWIEGDFAIAREELESFRAKAPKEEKKTSMDRHADRLWAFLSIEPPAAAKSTAAEEATEQGTNA
jgi:tetratricopeptide (TPR) repeat protein